MFKIRRENNERILEERPKRVNTGRSEDEENRMNAVKKYKRGI